MKKAMKEEKLLMNIKEACQFSGIGETTMYKLCNDPKNNFSIKRGNKHLIHREKFKLFLDTVKEI